MGRGIAYAAALGGYETLLQDVNETVVGQSNLMDSRCLGRRRKARQARRFARDAAVAHISTSSAVEEAVPDADLIIEAVPEEFQIKLDNCSPFDKCRQARRYFCQQHFRALHQRVHWQLSKLRDRCIGMHFFNPVPKMRLVEIIRTTHTSSETVATVAPIAHRMQKETVIVHEVPGFITRRINALIGNEAFAMLEAGVAYRRGH